MSDIREEKNKICVAPHRLQLPCHHFEDPEKLKRIWSFERFMLSTRLSDPFRLWK